MKFIRIILLLTLFCLKVGITQAFEFVNSDTSFTQQYIEKSINQVISVLERDYIFPEKSKIIANKLKYKLASNGFNQCEELGQFINDLGVLVRNVSGDGYLDIIETHSRVALGHASVSGKQKTIENFGFEQVEILSGNIGYVKLNYFYQNPKAELQATKVFNELSGTDAIIIDLRDVEGDSISLAQYMMSFFVEENIKLTNVVYDRQKESQIITSVKNVGFDHFKHDYPVYILTSAFVSGTGELFSYTLKHLNKAVIVGEKTMGVALISKKQKVNEFISINMPIAYSINPVTNSNWEQEGVIPDFLVEAKLSFDVAYKLAKDYLGGF
jgi:C-terminal processing protease CtpA/Prc